MLPKTYAFAFADRVALFVAPIMRATIVMLNPFTMAIQFTVRQILKLTPTRRDDAANILEAHEEIRGAIDLKTRGGAFAKRDAAMLGGVLDLRSLQVQDIMVHRTKMQTINVDDPPEKVVDEVLKSQHTRMPLVEGRAGEHRRSAAHQGPAAGARAHRLGRFQAGGGEPRRPALVRARHDDRHRPAQRVPKAQGAAGAWWSTSTARCRA